MFSGSTKRPLAPLSMHHVCLKCPHHKPLAQQHTVFHKTNKRHLDSIAPGAFEPPVVFVPVVCTETSFSTALFCEFYTPRLTASGELCNVHHFSGSLLRPFVGSFFFEQYLVRCPTCLHAWHTWVRFPPPFRTTRLSKTTTSRRYERCILVLSYVRCSIVSPVISYICHTESGEELGRERITVLTKA